MANVMVTARMSAEKKEAGSRILESLGTNASQAVNHLYDYVIDRKELPFSSQDAQRKYTSQEITQAIAWADSLPRKSRFSAMSDDDIRQERLLARGLASSEDFQ